MTMTDPIADMLTRLRNANQAYHDAVTMPYSKLKQGVAEILKQEGYITSFDVAEPAEGEVGKTLTITLKYGRNRERSIAGVRRISKPGLRVYAQVDDADAYLAKAQELGGKIIMPAMEVPGMGIRVGLFEDPEGNRFGVVQPLEVHG